MLPVTRVSEEDKRQKYKNPVKFKEFLLYFFRILVGPEYYLLISEYFGSPNLSKA
jgi:hypothetical protein